MGEDEQLRALHDTYVWEVNAAVGEDRPDLVSLLVDDYRWSRRARRVDAR